MALYLARAKASHEFMLNLVQRPEDRLATAMKLLEGIGGQLHHYYFSFGEYDIVLIYELPDNSKAASLSLVLNAAGSVTEVETTPLLTMEEAIDSMHTAGTALGIYQPPRGSDKTG